MLSFTFQLLERIVRPIVSSLFSPILLQDPSSLSVAPLECRPCRPCSLTNRHCLEQCPAHTRCSVNVELNRWVLFRTHSDQVFVFTALLKWLSSEFLMTSLLLKWSALSPHLTWSVNVIYHPWAVPLSENLPHMSSRRPDSSVCRHTSLQAPSKSLLLDLPFHNL